MLKIFNPDSLECEYIFPKVKSANWVKKFFSPGNFTITLSNHVSGAENLRKNSIITHGGNSGIIKYLHQNETGIEIKGYDLKGLCRQRIIVPPFVYMEEPTVESGYDRVKGTEEEVIRHYVQTHMAEPEDASRKIQNLSLADVHGYGNQLAWQAKFTNLADELENICIYSQLGYDIYFDEVNKRFVFDVIRGTDRTGTDEYYGFMTFGEKFHNVSGAEYTLDATNEKNVCYVTASGEEEQQFVYESYKEEVKGIQRSEGTTSASGTDDEDYIDEIQSQGNSFINENKASETIDAKTNERMKYGEDWKLGDFVTVVVKDCFGAAMELKRQITEVNQSWSHGVYTVEPTFGEKKKSTLRKLLRS